MARRRKSNAERDQERYEAEQKAWARFRPQLETIGCMADAATVLKGIPRPDSIGRNHYTNLLFFLDTLSPPGGASGEENRLYIEVARRMDAAGELKPGTFEQVEARLRQRIEERPW